MSSLTLVCSLESGQLSQLPLFPIRLFSGLALAQDGTDELFMSSESVFAGRQFPGPSERTARMQKIELEEDVPGISWTGPPSN